MCAFVSAGFLAIKRNHFYTPSNMDISAGIPVVITVPPAGTPAALNRNATLKAMEVYVDVENDLNSVITSIFFYKEPSKVKLQLFHHTNTATMISYNRTLRFNIYWIRCFLSNCHITRSIVDGLMLYVFYLINLCGVCVLLYFVMVRIRPIYPCPSGLLQWLKPGK